MKLEIRRRRTFGDYVLYQLVGGGTHTIRIPLATGTKKALARYAEELDGVEVPSDLDKIKLGGRKPPLNVIERYITEVNETHGIYLGSDILYLFSRQPAPPDKKPRKPRHTRNT